MTMQSEMNLRIDPEVKEPQSPRAFIEVRRSGASRAVPVGLSGGRQVVGRNVDLPIVLDHESVSRLHGEFVRDPYGQWWIHDLGSTNGTLVNGSAVTQRLLNPGDVIQIGDFCLRFRVAGVESNRSELLGATEPPPPPATQRSSTKRFQAVSGSPINAGQLSATMEFARELAEIEGEGTRLKTLCRFIVSNQFAGLRCWVVRVPSDGPPKLRVRPAVREMLALGEADWAELELLASRHAPYVARSAAPATLSWVGKDGEKRTSVTCAIDSEPEGFSILYAEFDSSLFSEEWAHMVGLLVDAYHQANVMWEMRGHIRAGAKVDHELEMARQIQDSLVSKSPRIPGLELAIGYEPCQWVGGDYVDAVQMADGRWLLAVADVCGKGLQAALVASSLHTLVHVAVDDQITLPGLVQRMNAYLCEYLPLHSFVTCICIAIDTKTGLMECVNAGHPPAVVVEKGGRTTLLQSEVNVALGMAESTFVSECTALCEGDVLFLYTDGLTEAEDRKQRALGMDGLKRELSRIVSSLPDGDLDTMQHRLTQAISLHRGTLMAADDTTFLIARLGDKRSLLESVLATGPLPVPRKIC